jgi:hypothetical protein
VHGNEFAFLLQSLNTSVDLKKFFFSLFSLQRALRRKVHGPQIPPAWALQMEIPESSRSRQQF